MNFDSLLKVVIMVGLMNVATTSYILVGRPDLAVRESSEKVFLVAMDLERQGKFKEAADLYERIFYDMSVTLVAPQAGARLADIYRRRLFDVEKARKVLREAAAYKESAYAEEAAKDLVFMDTHWGKDGSALKDWYQASHKYRTGDKRGSLAQLQQLIKDQPDASLRPIAMVRAAKIAKELSEYAVARQILKEYLALYTADAAYREAETLLRSIPQ